MAAVRNSVQNESRKENYHSEKGEIVICVFHEATFFAHARSQRQTNVNTSEDEVLLETCRALLVNKSEEKEINLLLDNASQRCFLKKAVASEMKLPVIREENLLVFTFGSRTPIQKKYEVVQITLCNPSDHENKITIEALLTDLISATPFRMSSNKIKQTLSSKKKIFKCQT
ncbi:DUF1758 domain-containing protein [Trichonephila clavata]|uniref:DUF1758 domain-containing protein n=1 Tax=Trichonephila clavata TaxID=2740835 RepID=A0A8X6J5K3_TRICU|nr:DUF1758 domain-containing protein [Trichonephila clavata]